MDYRPTPFDCGFVILSPNHNFGGLKTTVYSIRRHYPDCPHVCITSKDATAADIKEMKTLCPTYKGKNTITSLINTGIKKGHKKWNMLLMEGTIVKKGVMKRYSTFMEDEKDIMFSIVVDYDRDNYPTQIYSTVDNCSLNGFLIHQKTFNAIGEFSENPLDISRLWWADEAREKGMKFKAILGTKMC